MNKQSDYVDGTNPNSGPQQPHAEVAVIGAGMAGLTAARLLSNNGRKVTVFDKGRGPGGRMSTRRGPDGQQFDHGCQYFSADGDEFREAVQEWLNAGIVAQWNGRVLDLSEHGRKERPSARPRYVGVPAMNSICKHLAKSLPVRQQVLVDRIERNTKWVLHSGHDCVGTFDQLLISIPPAQAFALLDTFQTSATSTLADLTFQQCWAGMFSFDTSLGFEAGGAVVSDSILSWISVDSRKPQRNSQQECWVVHANPIWSQQNFELDRQQAASVLADELFRVLNTQPIPTTYRTAHRWRYAIPSLPHPERHVFDKELQLVLCGDWCAGNRVEAAYVSGATAARRLMAIRGTLENDSTKTVDPAD